MSKIIDWIILIGLLGTAVASDYDGGPANASTPCSTTSNENLDVNFVLDRSLYWFYRQVGNVDILHFACDVSLVSVNASFSRAFISVEFEPSFVLNQTIDLNPFMALGVRHASQTRRLRRRDARTNLLHQRVIPFHRPIFIHRFEFQIRFLLPWLSHQSTSVRIEPHCKCERVHICRHTSHIICRMLLRSRCMSDRFQERQSWFADF